MPGAKDFNSCLGNQRPDVAGTASVGLDPACNQINPLQIACDDRELLLLLLLLL